DMTRVSPTAESYALAARLWTMFGNRQQADAVRAEARRTFAEAQRGLTTGARAARHCSDPRGFAPRTPPHALSRAAEPARSVRVARSRARSRRRGVVQIFVFKVASPVGIVTSSPSSA